MASPLVFAHIRASSRSPVHQTYCHPFRHGGWLWMRNGAVREFDRVKRDLVLAVDPALYTKIEASTDSELLFDLALTSGSPMTRLRRWSVQSDWWSTPVAAMGSSIRSR